MIQHITGTIQATDSHSVTVLIGPIGLELSVPDSTKFETGKQVTIYMYMHWNQENGPSLYGFTAPFEKEVFLLIISCSGIGPKIGLAAIEQLGSEGFIEAIQTGNERLLSSVSGIGIKKAEQMIVHLKHKISSLLESGVKISSPRIAHRQTIVEALKALNYSRIEINRTLDYLKDKTEDGHGFDQLMRRALSFLAK